MSRLAQVNSRSMMPIGGASLARMRLLREAFIESPATTDLSELRPVIARSWLRSEACKVNPHTAIETITEPRVDEPLLSAARPVLADLRQLMQDAEGAVGLADPNSTMMLYEGDPKIVSLADESFPIYGGAMTEEIVGTNSDGIAIEERRGAQVWGGEHFSDALQDTYCTSVPIFDPVRQSIRAVLSITLHEDVARQIDPAAILYTAQGAVAEITRRLMDRLAIREQAVLAAYLQATRTRGSELVVAMAGTTVMATQAASRLLSQSDYAVLASYALEAEQGSNGFTRNITLQAGSAFLLRVQPIASAGDVFGALLRLKRLKTLTPRETTLLSSGGPEQRFQRPEAFDSIVGDSVAIRKAIEVAATASSRKLPAYVIGEPGTGKQTIACAIGASLADRTTVVHADELADHHNVLSLLDDHDAGRAIVIAHAEKLPELMVGELVDYLAAQANKRIVLTLRRVTDEVLPLVQALSGIEVRLPSLRERREDIPALIREAIRRTDSANREVSIRLVEALSQADWPGNASELMNVVANMVSRTHARELDVAHFSEIERRMFSRSRLSRLEEMELQQIREALNEAGGNRVKAAALLGIGRSTLYRKMDSYQARGFPVP